MADLALTKIFDKMPNGGTAIGGNFDDVAAAVNANTHGVTAANAEKSYVKVNVGLYSTQGTLGFYRKGAHVRFSGYVKLAQAWGNNVSIIDVPTGYRPQQVVQITVHADKNYLARVDGNGTKVYATGAVPLGAYLWMETGWDTDDDFPS